MKEESVEYFHGNKLDVEKEKQRKRELMLYFPKTLGIIDKTRYVLWDNDKKKLDNNSESKAVIPSTVLAKNEPVLNFHRIGELQSEKPEKKETSRTFVQNIDKLVTNENVLGYGNSDSEVSFFNPQKKNVTKYPFDFESDTNEGAPSSFNQNVEYLRSSNKPRTTSVESDSLGSANRKIENRLDSVSYDNKGHMSVTFRNDVMGTDGFKAFDPADKAGCKRRCMEMLAYSGCELSGERIDMTINDDKGRAISQSNDFQKGINAIDNALDKEQTIILNVDYKDGTAASADKAGDHFIIIVGRTIIDEITYYHFYDPATQFVDFGTADTNVLYIKDGFLQGCFVKRNGSVNKYKVTSVRLNK